jgi:prepilin-type N-terminal cleavage/methylation domain-containing protein
MKMTRHNRRGMTLMELLVVTIILGLLMALGLGIGSTLLTKADRQKTIGTMAIVMGAIDTYYEQCGAYPPQRNAARNDSDGNIVMVDGKIVWNDPPPAAYGATQYDYSDFLLLMLKSCPASQKALSALDQQAMEEGAYSGSSFIDGFNLPILYNATGGFGGTPKLLSAGPDGKYRGVSIRNQVGGSAQMGGKDDDITSGSK